MVKGAGMHDDFSTSFRNSDALLPIMQGAPPPVEWRVPPDAWDQPPWNRWAFQNIRRILPTAEIRRGPDVTPWPHALQDLSSIGFTGFENRPMTVADMLDDFTDGFLVVKDGAIIFEVYLNGMTRQSVHLAQSVSKSVVATTGGVLIDQGVMDPAAPITTYLPELAATAWKGATLQHVLDMTSGVKFSEEYTDPLSDMGMLDVSCGWKPRPEGCDPAKWPATLWDHILSLTERDAEHGSRFEYRSIETDVLGLAIERASGMNLNQAVSHLIWAPMGAEQDASFTVDPANTCLADGGMSASLRDFARFGQTMLDEGRVGERQVIPKSWIADVRAGSHGLFNEDLRAFLPNGCYRNKFWIRDQSQHTHMSLGVFGQFIYVSPEQGLVVAKLSSWPDFLSDEHHHNTMSAIDAIAAELS